jgi:hypothetical protein
MKPFWRLLVLSAVTGTLLASAGNTRTQLLITGNDEKVSFDETGKTVTHPPGKDTVSIIGIRDPTKSRIVANMPLMNSITGRRSTSPLRRTITWPWSPTRSIGVKDGEAWKSVLDNKRPEGFQVQR